MRITRETRWDFIQNKTWEFTDRASSFLISRFGDLITSKNLTRPVLGEMVHQCYLWTENHSYPSQLLAVRIACARLCFGSFFMEDPRYTALSDIINEHVRTHAIDDDDHIHAYIAEHKADWQTDWFTERLPLIRKLCTVRNSSSRNTFQPLFDAEQRSSFSLSDDARHNIPQELLKSVPTSIYYDESEQSKILLAIAQYYDGFRCFDDPLQPRWYGILEPEHRQHLQWRLQDIFGLKQQQG